MGEDIKPSFRPQQHKPDAANYLQPSSTLEDAYEFWRKS